MFFLTFLALNAKAVSCGISYINYETLNPKYLISILALSDKALSSEVK